MKSKNIILTISILTILIFVLILFLFYYFSQKLVAPEEGQEIPFENGEEKFLEDEDIDEDIKDIAEFYAKKYHAVLEKESTYDCNIKMDVSLEEKSVLIEMDCNVSPPYSALEAFYSVLRGKIETDGVMYDSNIPEGYGEKEAFKEKIEVMDYPFVTISDSEESENYETESLCFLPCVDSANYDYWEVMDVSYDPSREELISFFNNYSEEKFEDLIVNSKYSFEVYYSKMENVLEWRYLLGQFYEGKFKTELFLDRPVERVDCRREETDSPEESTDFNCEVTEINKSNFEINGFTDGFYKLIIEF